MHTSYNSPQHVYWLSASYLFEATMSTKLSKMQVDLHDKSEIAFGDPVAQTRQ